MRDRHDYEEALRIVGKVIRAWDPYGLLAESMPEDEFSAEIVQLVTHVPRMHTAKEAAQALSAVFSAAFGPESFSATACAAPGAELFAELAHSGLVEGPNNSFKPTPLRGAA